MKRKQAPFDTATQLNFDRREWSKALGLAVTAAAWGLPMTGHAQKKYGPGVTDKEIKIGQTMPYSGPASAFGVGGRIQLAYFKMINAQGGVNGRQINMVSLDDGFSPPKAVEMARKLVEEENVLAIMGSVGTPTNVTISRYLNAKQVPQLVVATGSSKMDDPAGLPWTAPFYASQAMEGQLYGEYLVKSKPDAKIGILYQNDDYGKGNLDAFKKGLGAKASSMIVKEVSYELSDPTVDNQIIALKASGADTFFQSTSSKFAAQAIRKSHEIGWKPLQIVISNVSSIAATLRPAGLEASKGLVTSVWLKFPGDPTWNNDKQMQDYLAFIKKWAPNESPEEFSGAFGYIQAALIVELLKRCGDDLTRENLLKQAVNLKDLELPLFVPGVKINTTPSSRVAWRQTRLARFDGTNWVLFGDVMTWNETK
jgi:branched-chain amino acid transport system substrate-binding protein